MKIIFFLSCLIMSTVLVQAQSPSQLADSIMKKAMVKVPLQMKPVFNYLIAQRMPFQVKERMDTIKYDYVYIEERFNHLDSTISAVEYYFNTNPGGMYRTNFEDSSLLPDQLYQNGQLIDHRYVYYSSSVAGVVFSGEYEYYYTLDSILNRCASLKTFQELSYDNTPRVAQMVKVNYKDKVDTNSVRNHQADLTYKAMLASTYQVVTLVDQVKKRVIVSLQTPAKHPEINSYIMQFNSMDW